MKAKSDEVYFLTHGNGTKQEPSELVPRHFRTTPPHASYEYSTSYLSARIDFHERSGVVLYNTVSFQSYLCGWDTRVDAPRNVRKRMTTISDPH